MYQGFISSEIATFLSFVHSSQRNLHYSIFPLQKTICILFFSLAKAVCSYSVLLGRMKTNAASLDETKVTAHKLKSDGKRLFQLTFRSPTTTKLGLRQLSLVLYRRGFKFMSRTSPPAALTIACEAAVSHSQVGAKRG